MTTDRPVPPAPATRRADDSGAPWLLLAALGLIGFVALTLVIASGAKIPFDQPLLDLGRSWDAWANVWRLLSDSANIPLIVIGVGLVGWLFFTKRRREALVVLILLIAITAGSEAVKQLTARPRPSGTDPNIPGVVFSYPSGHVLEALTILGIIAIRCWRSFQHLAPRVIVAVLVAAEVILVGVARVSLSAHYPSDVLAGLLGGAAALGIYGWLTRRGGFTEPDREHREATKTA